MADDQSEPPAKKFVRTGTEIRESFRKVEDPNNKAKKSEKKSG
jgi:hypothetical protein